MGPHFLPFASIIYYHQAPFDRFMRLDSGSLSPNLLTLGMGPIETSLVYEIKYFISKIHARNDRPR